MISLLLGITRVNCTFSIINQILRILSGFTLESMPLSFSYPGPAKHFDVITLSEIWFGWQSLIIKICGSLMLKRKAWTRVQEDWDVTQDSQPSFVLILDRPCLMHILISYKTEAPLKFSVLFVFHSFWWHKYCDLSFQKHFSFGTSSSQHFLLCP